MSLRPFAAFVGIAGCRLCPAARRRRSRRRRHSPPIFLPRTCAPADASDYVKREEMIPMRDGVKLYTVIVMPKGARARRSS